MSTKTSIKRIALVAAAALAIGGFSAVSANAAASTITQVAGTGDNGAGGIAGPANTLKVLITHATSSAAFVSITGGSILSASNSNTVAASGLTVLLGSSNATDTLTIATPTAGSLVVNVYDEVTAGSGTFPAAVTTTKTITISTAGVSGVFSAAKSSVYITAGRATSGAALTADDASAITKSSTVPSPLDSTTVAATIQVGYFDGNAAAMKDAADTITATITSGPGVIGGNVDSTTSAAAATAATYSVNLGTNVTTHGIYSFYLYANGQTGTSVVSIKNSAGTVLGTKSIVFAGTTPKRIEATVVKKAVLNSATKTDKVLSVKLYDAAVGGNSIPSLSNAITGTVATGSLIGGAIAAADCSWNATDSVYYCSIGAAATPTTAGGTEVYTLSAGTGVTTTASVKFVTGTATSVTVAGPASADPGTKVTYTLNAQGLADGAYAAGSIFTNADPVSNVAWGASVPFGANETITVVDGVATDYTYAPFGGVLSASWTLAGTAATAQTVANISVAAATFSAAGLDKAITKTAVAADDVTITGNTEATAAANAATDAANQAADAADNATQAAAEALAAVNTLATTVATLIAGIKSQIASLNKLIVAIKNKLKA